MTRATPERGASRPARPWPLFRAFEGASAQALARDCLAGLTLAAIAIPEQMATARLGGFAPHIGFIAFVAGALAFAVFGASRLLSSGADSTITPIFAGSIALLAAAGSPEYAALAATLALMVGALLVLASLLRAGWVADLLSLPVMTGFLAGVSVHIALSQAPALLGSGEAKGEIFRRVAALAASLPHANPYTLALGLGTLATIAVAEKISPRIPGALIALAAATFATAHFHLEAKGVAVIGALAAERPRFALPAPDPDDLPRLLGLAVIIAMIVMVQTAATARSFPDAPGASADVDRDFLGLGAGSLLAGLFGGFPVNASPPRTAVVAQTGGRTQAASLWAALAVVGVAAFGAQALAIVPGAALAGVLLYVAAHIFRLGVMADIFSKTRSEFALTLATLAAVVILPVQTGVALAIILSLLHGVWATTRTRLIRFERLPGSTVWWPQTPQQSGETLEGVLVVGFQAPLSFLNAQLLKRDLLAALNASDPQPKLVVLEASSIVEVDFTAARTLTELLDACRARGVEVALARLESLRALEALRNFGVLTALGEGRLFHSVDEATRTLAGEKEQGVES